MKIEALFGERLTPEVQLIRWFVDAQWALGNESFIYLCMYFWLHWVFVVVCELSSCSAWAQ